ncbi:carboxymuconolactone decarboxylase family protein [Enterobacter hormaechei]|uniref:carboxymuconolactone decarboxylase family protein n=1 Tax=Enterobacter hormaechei TaxID=158836 RepID=UPI0021B46CED|nr:carboxymuconolactone decarboxylase family protein [Enterobacter hormaechei]MCT7304399.1 carboxymuconolactone decarboxylase family protein [Enterobacter hormaechei]
MTSKHEEVIAHYDSFHATVYGADGALDRKTRHLICLGAALGASCEPCTKYALGVLRELQASDAEIDEAISVAMTVGASSARLLAKQVRTENL